MSRLLRAIQRAWVKHQLRTIATAIDYEERQHQLHARRMEHWLHEQRELRADLRLLEYAAHAQRERLGSTLLAGGAQCGSDGRHRLQPTLRRVR
jgi:hypothetical protein